MDEMRHHRPRQHSSGSADPTVYIAVESHLRVAGRGLELAGVSDPESARLARVVFRLPPELAGRIGASG
jgi:hypothetical protein